MPILTYKSSSAKSKEPGVVNSLSLLQSSLKANRGASGQGAKASGSWKNKPLFAEKVRSQDVLFFTRQLYTLHRAGIPITEGLGTIATHEKNTTLKQIMFAMKQDVEEGMTLTDAMRKHPKAFSHFYTGVVEGGEQNGVLSEMLVQLTHYMQNEEEVRRSIKSALRYPFFVGITLAAALTVIMTFIFPRFKPLFSKFGDDLPYQTKVLLVISSVLQNQWMFLLSGLVVAIGLFVFVKRYRVVRHVLDHARFRIPLLGSLYQYACISRFANMLSTFFSGGIVDYLNIMALTEKAFENVVIKKEIRRLSNEITNGKSLGESMERSKLFPPLFSHLTYVGEKTGEINSMMKVLYDYYEQDLRFRTQKLIAIIEPMILLATSGFVLFIALGIFMPYWRLMEVVN
jgi:MSHA biogenesis protein MshG